MHSYLSDIFTDVEVKWKNKMSGNYSIILLHEIYDRIDSGYLK